MTLKQHDQEHLSTSCSFYKGKGNSSTHLLCCSAGQASLYMDPLHHQEAVKEVTSFIFLQISTIHLSVSCPTLQKTKQNATHFACRALKGEYRMLNLSSTQAQYWALKHTGRQHALTKCKAIMPHTTDQSLNAKVVSF